jgi:adenylate cyclase, class 2
MKTEFEVKILNIDVDYIQEKLKKLNAKKIMNRNMKRFVYDFNPKKEKSWIRLRDNGQKTTLTIKEIQNDKIDGTKELAIEVSDFEKTNKILERLGYINRSYQENKRISYILDNVKIEIDFWPMLKPYLEIEGNSVKEVENIIKKLGFTMTDTTTMNTKEIYKQQNIDTDKIKELKF